MPQSTLDHPIAPSAPEIGSRRPAVVKWYSLAKGYGFASLPGDERDVFLHHSQLEDGSPLEEGEQILIELGQGERGLFGARIQRAVAASAESVGAARD